jgi:hypothetical protein
MTAYAPTWTGRLKLTYFGGSAAHTQTWRYPGPSSGSGVTDLITAIDAYLTALEPLMWDDFAVSAVTVADVGSPVFLPIVNPFTAITGAVAFTGFVPEDKAKVLTFVGRTTSGNPWHLAQFGLDTNSLQAGGSTNYRILTGENADVTNAIAALQAGAGIILGNDAGSVAVYNYANLKSYDRWVKKVRRGA